MRKVYLCVLWLVLCGGCGPVQTIRRAPELPATTPWDLGELSKSPAFEWVDEDGPVRSLLYDGEPYGGKPTRAFAYYATPGTLGGDPSKDRNLPGVVLVHGGGGTAFREWAELWAKRGYAAIAMDLAGSRPIEGLNPHDPKNRERLPDGGPGQGHEEKFGTIDGPVTENWCYHAVAAVIRAHSLLRTLPGVDAERTAVTGISWGGYLTCIVASLDNRFGAAVPVYGCGFLHENSAWLDEFAKLGPERTRKWVELYDPSRYLPACRVPIFFVNGTNDFAYPLDSYMKSYDAVKHAPKNIRITVNMPHSHPAGWEPKEIGMFVDSMLLDADPLLILADPKRIDGHYYLRLVSSRPIHEFQMHYTVDETPPINKRDWITVDLLPIKPLRPGKHGPLHHRGFDPPEESTASFVTVTDDRGATVSSPVILKSPTPERK